MPKIETHFNGARIRPLAVVNGICHRGLVQWHGEDVRVTTRSTSSSKLSGDRIPHRKAGELSGRRIQSPSPHWYLYLVIRIKNYATIFNIWYILRRSATDANVNMQATQALVSLQRSEVGTIFAL